MGLYPTIELSAPGLFELPSGNLGLIPFDLPPLGVMEIVTAHLSPVQDHSLRAWVSLRPAGIALPLDPTSVWHPNRTPDEIVTIYDAEFAGIRRANSIMAPPGRLWLNVLNLINLPNAFSVKIAPPN